MRTTPEQALQTKCRGPRSQNQSREHGASGHGQRELHLEREETTNNPQYSPGTRQRFRCCAHSAFQTKPKARAVWNRSPREPCPAHGAAAARNPRGHSPDGRAPTAAPRLPPHAAPRSRPQPADGRRTSPRRVQPRFQKRRATQKRGTRRPRAPQPARHGGARLRLADRAFRGRPRERRRCPPPRPGPRARSRSSERAVTADIKGAETMTFPRPSSPPRPLRPGRALRGAPRARPRPPSAPRDPAPPALSPRGCVTPGPARPPPAAAAAAPRLGPAAPLTARSGLWESRCETARITPARQRPLSAGSSPPPTHRNRFPTSSGRVSTATAMAAAQRRRRRRARSAALRAAHGARRGQRGALPSARWVRAPRPGRAGGRSAAAARRKHRGAGEGRGRALPPSRARSPPRCGPDHSAHASHCHGDRRHAPSPSARQREGRGRAAAARQRVRRRSAAAPGPVGAPGSGGGTPRGAPRPARPRRPSPARRREERGRAARGGPPEPRSGDTAPPQRPSPGIPRVRRAPTRARRPVLQKGCGHGPFPRLCPPLAPGCVRPTEGQRWGLGYRARAGAHRSGSRAPGARVLLAQPLHGFQFETGSASCAAASSPPRFSCVLAKRPSIHLSYCRHRAVWERLSLTSC